MITVKAMMNGAERDLTPFCYEATWKHGSKQENYFGQLADPAEGNLSLWNQGGEFTSYNPASWVDPTPGPDVWIEHQGTRLFTGKSAYILNSADPSQAHDSAEMPLLGPLAFLSRFSERLFSTLDGDQRTSAVWENILDAVGFDGTKLTETGLTTLSAVRVNRASLLGEAEKRVGFLNALRTVVQAEVGRGYDDRMGRAVFRSRQHRSAFWATATAFTLDASNARIQSAQTPNVIDTIINRVEGRFQGFTAQGVQSITFADLTLPMAFTVPPGGRNIVLPVDTSGQVVFVQDWVDPVSGTDYTYTLPGVTPTFEKDPLQPTLRIPNTTTMDATFTLTQLRGNPRHAGVRERIEIESARSVAAPPDGYGPRPVIYPADLLNDTDEITDHLRWCVLLHDGFDTEGNKDINRIRSLTVDVNLRRAENSGLIGIDIDSLVNVSEPRLGLSAAPFFVDSAEYRATADPQTFDLTLELSDARATMMWPIDGMRFGFNTRIGF